MADKELTPQEFLDALAALSDRAAVSPAISASMAASAYASIGFIIASGNNIPEEKIIAEARMSVTMTEEAVRAGYRGPPYMVRAGDEVN